MGDAGKQYDAALVDRMLARTLPAAEAAVSLPAAEPTAAPVTVAAASLPADVGAGASSAGQSALLQRLGRFVLLRQLGEGGMGRVYAAYDEELDRKVALKVLHLNGLGGSEGRTRVLREAQAMARVSHPNVVPVYSVGEFDGELFIAMEFVDGQTLYEWQRQPRSAGEILAMYQAAGQGLLAAHQAGLVHRGPFYNHKPSRNRDLKWGVKTLGKLRKNGCLGLVLDGGEQGGAFSGAHRAQ